MSDCTVLYMLVRLYWLCLLYTIAYGSDYDLSELAATTVDAPITQSKGAMNAIMFAINMEQTAKTTPNGPAFRKYLCEESEDKAQLKCQNERVKPQWIVSYDPDEEACMVYIVGTEKDSLIFDWKNGVNIVPKGLTLTAAANTPSIEIHGGTYDAIDTPLFYKGSQSGTVMNGLFDDIKIIMTNKKVTKLIFVGHSQGGAIATAMLIIWKGGHVCPFRTYFASKSAFKGQNKAITFGALMDGATVATFGTFGIIGHSHMNTVDGLYHESIINFIIGLDPVPMIYNGQQTKPTAPFPNKEWGITATAVNSLAQGMLNNYDTEAYYAPVGTYYCLWVDNLLIRSLVQSTPLFTSHLVNG
eukprot:315667_1